MLSLKSRRRRSRWSRQSSRSPWLTALLLMASVPIGIELLARLITMVTGFNATVAENAVQQKTQGYQLQFVNAEGKPYEEQLGNGELQARRNPLLGYQLLPNQSNPFWSLNAQGFREDDALAAQKADGEVRIFIVGGSTAFGQLNTDNAHTLAHKMEQLLTQRIEQQRTSPERFQPPVLPYRADQVQEALALPPRIKDGQYRVINAAVPGYASGNDLAHLMHQVVRYNPDIVIVLNGYPDLLLPSDQPAADVPGLEALLQNETSGFSQVGDRFQNGIGQLMAVKIYRHYKTRSQPQQPALKAPLNIAATDLKPSLNDYVGGDAAELDQRVQRYRDNLDQMVKWASGSQKRLIIGIQPEITGRAADQLTAAETTIISNLDESYQQWMKAGYERLNTQANEVAKQSANATVVNLYSAYDSFPDQAFQSPTSLTDEATAVLANRLYEAIANQLSLRPVSFAEAN